MWCLSYNTCEIKGYCFFQECVKHVYSMRDVSETHTYIYIVTVLFNIQ